MHNNVLNKSRCIRLSIKADMQLMYMYLFSSCRRCVIHSLDQVFRNRRSAWVWSPGVCSWLAKVIQLPTVGLAAYEKEAVKHLPSCVCGCSCICSFVYYLHLFYNNDIIQFRTPTCEMSFIAVEFLCEVQQVFIFFFLSLG